MSSSEFTFLGLELKVMYHLYPGRRVFESIGVEQHKGPFQSIHLTFDKAARKAETQRVQGRVFTIEQVPTLVINSDSKIWYYADFSTFDPFEISKKDKDWLQQLTIGSPLEPVLEHFYKAGLRTLSNPRLGNLNIRILVYSSDGSYFLDIGDAQDREAETLETPVKLKKWNSYARDRMSIGWKKSDLCVESPGIDFILNQYHEVNQSD